MFKLSTRGRYGTRVMLELALNYGRGFMLLKAIAKNQEISAGYLEQIVPSLKTAGLIHSSRGAHGGYVLSRPPDQITLREIIVALEGPIVLVECIKAPQICNRYNYCSSRDLWNELGQKIEETLESKTLQDMIENYK
ncbi:MAG: Rrf2 family transcriptional regulator [Actinomycetota bacterium]|nr:Rrf2 family transcriptional regulator [Actinomycetota bacterium]